MAWNHDREAFATRYLAFEKKKLKTRNRKKKPMNHFQICNSPRHLAWKSMTSHLHEINGRLQLTSTSGDFTVQNVNCLVRCFFRLLWFSFFQTFITEIYLSLLFDLECAGSGALYVVARFILCVPRILIVDFWLEYFISQKERARWKLQISQVVWVDNTYHR